MKLAPDTEYDPDMRHYPRFWHGYLSLGLNASRRAARLGLTQRAVGLWEAGARMPTVYSLRNWPEGLRLLAADLEEKGNQHAEL